MINLDGKRFSPIKNSGGGRVASNTVFDFTQTGKSFSAHYHGGGVTDGHLIGTFTEDLIAELVYHSRSSDGELEAGQARAVFSNNQNGKLSIDMDWQWMNGSLASGQSRYEEL